MSVGNKALLHRWFEEVWNRKRPEMIDELIAADALMYGFGEPRSQVVKGPAGFKVYWEQYVSAFPDIHIAVEATVSERETAVARCSVRGTHQGEGLGMPATGRRINITGTAVVTFRKGQIIEAWNNFDFFSLYEQLGVMQIRRD